MRACCNPVWSKSTVFFQFKQNIPCYWYNFSFSHFDLEVRSIYILLLLAVAKFGRGQFLFGPHLHELNKRPASVIIEFWPLQKYNLLNKLETWIYVLLLQNFPKVVNIPNLTGLVHPKPIFGKPIQIQLNQPAEWEFQ